MSKHNDFDIGMEHKVDLVAQLIESLDAVRLRHSEAQNIAKLGHWSLDLVNDKLHWSDEIFRIFGLNPETFTASYDSFLDAIHPEDRDAVNDAYSVSLNTQAPYAIEHRLLMPDGSIKWVIERCNSEFSEDGVPLLSIGTVQDVTKQKLLEIEKERLFHAMGERIKELQTLYGLSQSIQKRGELGDIFMDTLELMRSGWQYPDITQAAIRFEGQLYASCCYTESAWRQCSDIIIHGKRCGTVEVCYLEECPQLDEGPFMKEERSLIDAIALMLSQAIELRQANEKITLMAHYDQLTGLPNRSIFFDRLEYIIASASRHGKKSAVFFLDLDGFKAVNDTLGHEAGDKLLKDVALCLKDCLREEDTVARIGGDEFAIILAECNSSRESSIVAKKIISAIQTSFGVGKFEPPIGVSIGIAFYPNADSSAKEVLKLADMAMYQIKKGSKNSYHIHQ